MERKQIAIADAERYLRTSYTKEVMHALQRRSEKSTKIEYDTDGKFVIVYYRLVPDHDSRIVFFDDSVNVYHASGYEMYMPTNGVQKPIDYLFEEGPRHIATSIKVAKIVDEALGPLAVRLKEEYSVAKYKAGTLCYEITTKGTIRAWYPYTKEYSVEEALPVIRAELQKEFPWVTRRSRDVTNILYIYKPASINSKCPNEEVLAHFRAIRVQIATWRPDEVPCFEPGSVSNYKNPKGLFIKGGGWCGWHRCEGKCENQPSSSSKDYHLLFNGQPTNFATNSLALHYLEEHWQDVFENKDELDRLNQYLEAVNLKPV